MESRKNNSFLISLLSISLAFAVGGLAGQVTQEAIPHWYAQLNKPFFNPPNIIFGPVWTLLYFLMGWAAARVFLKGRHHKWGKTALYHYGAQLVLNGLWSLVFFGLQQPIAGFVLIVILLFLIERSIHWFRLVDKTSSYMLYPYLAWVSFAGLLNLSIVILN